MRLLLAIVFTILIPVISLAKESTSNRIAVVVNQYLSGEIKDSLNTYFQDLRNEGYETILKEWSLEDNPSPSELKDYLKSLYQNGGLQGAVFIGDLPVVIFEAPNTANVYERVPYATDNYYMDLESDEWEDTDKDGYMDKPVFTKENVSKRAIWVSRLLVGRGSWFKGLVSYISGSNINEEPRLVNAYFKKNHEFRTGTRLYKERTWNYIINEFLEQANREYSDDYSNSISLNRASDFFLGELSKTAFLKLLNEGSNEMGMWVAHGYGDYIRLNKNETLSSGDLRSINLETAFILPISCWIGDYTARDYFSGALIFSEKSGVQALIAPTKPVRLWRRNLFAYPFQEGSNFGMSYLDYLSSVGQLLETQDLLDDERSRILFGDGTLKRQRYLIGADKIEPGDTTLRSAELRKEITPSYIFPLINTLRFEFRESKWFWDSSPPKIMWDKYYINDDLTYRLEKEDKNGGTRIIYEGKDNEAPDENLLRGNKYFLSYIWDDPNAGLFTSKRAGVIAGNGLLGMNLLTNPNLRKYITFGENGELPEIQQNQENEINDEFKQNQVSDINNAINAILQNDLGAFSSLLTNGANPNQVNDEGESLLIFATMNNRPDMVALLIMKGADLRFKDLDGKTALDYAVENDYQNIVELLTDAESVGNEDGNNQVEI